MLLSATKELTTMRTVSSDRLGIWASSLCMIHCIATPIVLSLSAVSVHFLPSEERTHRSLAIIIAALGAIAIVRGFRKHRRRRVVLLCVSGLACIWGTAWWGESLPSHFAEVALTVFGSCLMIAAHRLNHTFCASCPCAGPTC